MSLINSSYDKRIRPPSRDVNGRNSPVVVAVNVYVRSMSNIDFPRMQYDLHLTLRQFWRDPRLAYEELFPGAKVPKFLIITEKDVIWTPDTFFSNEKRAHRHDIDKLNLLIRIHANGTVMYSQRLSLTLSCPMYLQKYPMDQQNCVLILGSYAFTVRDIVYRWQEESAIQYHPVLNTSLPSFSLGTAETSECSSTTSTGEYSCIQTKFTLTRLFRFYIAQVYLPSTLLVVVSWVSFWLDRSAVPARITLGVTTLLTMTTQAAAIGNSLPPVSYIKAVDVWVTTCLAFIFATVLEFAVVSYSASSNLVHCQEEGPRVAVEKDDGDEPPQTHRRDSWGATKHQEMKPLHDEFGSERKASYCFEFWRKWRVGADSTKMIDLKSRILFPLSFVFFNVIYWTWYSSL